MLQMITGYWVTQIVGAVASLGIVDHVAKGTHEPEALARACSADADAMKRLLRACASLGLLACSEDGGYRVTPLGETLGSAPGSMRGMAIAQAAPGHWLPWGRLRDAVASGTRQTPATLGSEIFEYYGAHPEEASAFSGAMAGLSAMVARDVVENLDTRGVARVVDVGGFQRDAGSRRCSTANAALSRRAVRAAARRRRREGCAGVCWPRRALRGGRRRLLRRRPRG